MVKMGFRRPNAANISKLGYYSEVELYWPSNGNWSKPVSKLNMVKNDCVWQITVTIVNVTTL